MRIIFLLLLLMGMAGFSSAQTITVLDEEDRKDEYLLQTNEDLRNKVNALGPKTTEHFRVPVLGVSLESIYDSWGAPRPGGRLHEGNDILAPRGAFIVSPTDAVVLRIGVGVNGGNFVYTYNPGGERFYYAHLEGIAEGVETGRVLKPGDLIGYVGETGNAEGGPMHIHFGIYKNGAENPFPRLTLEFSREEKVQAFGRILESSSNKGVMAHAILTWYKEFILETVQAGILLPPALTAEIKEALLVQSARRDITLQARGNDVLLLQQYLIAKNAGPASLALANAGASGYFGSVSKNALAEFQQAVGIVPATGYFGARTRSSIASTRLKTILAVHARRISYIPSLKNGSKGEEVEELQRFLIAANSGVWARALEKAGVTGYFGPTTKKALAEFQRIVGINPAQGNFGPITRAYFTL